MAHIRLNNTRNYYCNCLCFLCIQILPSSLPSSQSNHHPCPTPPPTHIPRGNSTFCNLNVYALVFCSLFLLCNRATRVRPPPPAFVCHPGERLDRSTEAVGSQPGTTGKCRRVERGTPTPPPPAHPVGRQAGGWRRRPTAAAPLGQQAAAVRQEPRGRAPGAKGRGGQVSDAI